MPQDRRIVSRRRDCSASGNPLLWLHRLNDTDPEAWLADVVARIADHPISKLDELSSNGKPRPKPLPHSHAWSSDHAYPADD